MNELGKRLFSVWRYLNWSMQRTETVSAIYRRNICLVLPPEPVMSDSTTRVEPLVSDFIVSLAMARLNQHEVAFIILHATLLSASTNCTCRSTTNEQRPAPHTINSGPRSPSSRLTPYTPNTICAKNPTASSQKLFPSTDLRFNFSSSTPCSMRALIHVIPAKKFGSLERIMHDAPQVPQK